MLANQEITHTRNECRRDENIEVDVRQNKDRIRNERFQEHLGIVSISDKTKETHLDEEKFFYAG